VVPRLKLLWFLWLLLCNSLGLVEDFGSLCLELLRFAAIWFVAETLGFGSTWFFDSVFRRCGCSSSVVIAVLWL
jgi:hypothetical protein